MAVTAHNTGLSISRNGDKFTAKWKIAAKDVTDQDVRYRTYNGEKWGGWNTKDLGKSTTSYTFSLDASKKINKVQVQTRTKAKNKTVSEWGSSSAVYTVAAPPNPTVSMSRSGPNNTVFSISNNANATNTHWYYATYYRTRLSSGNWSKWATIGSSASYNDTVTGVYRQIQVKNKGPAGWSKTVTSSHYLGAPPIPTWGRAPSYTKRSSYYQMTVNANISGSTLTVDKIVPQYFIGTPTANITPASDSSWQDGADYFYNNNYTNYTMAINTNELIDTDECLWVRVKTEHDSIVSASTAYRVITGVLAAPTCDISVGTISASGFNVNITDYDANTSVPGAYAQVYLEKASATGLENYILLGTIPNGSTSATIRCDLDITHESGLSIHVRNVSADGSTMKSGFYTYKTEMPASPILDGITPSTVSGKVHVDWTTTWRQATGTIIAWTEDPDNWSSNDEPEQYEISEDASGWYIVGLQTGTVWYFRVRSVKTEGDNVNYSPWSNEMSIDLASAPAIPVLFLSAETITDDGMVTAYWSYVTTDGTSQIAGEVVEAQYSNGEWTYGDKPVGATTDAQHVDIYAADNGWTNGSTKYLSLRTRSGSGGTSDYSTPVKLEIAAKPSVSITSAGFTSTNTIRENFIGDGETTEHICEYALSAAPTVTVDGEPATVTYLEDVVTFASAPDEGSEIDVTYTTTDFNALETMPLTVEVEAENAGTLSLAIERALDYPMLRPDGEVTEGPAGETVYLETIAADSTNSMSVDIDELIGRLDDGAHYTLVATATDNYGQEAEERIAFVVHWAHQAEEPDATFITDTDNYIARITPIAPAGYETGDTCDIYRLSVDKPELIRSGATFGIEYVDLYPAFGEYSGYKLVTITATDDYITEDNTFADLDTTDTEEEIYTQLDLKTFVIDFGGNRVELPYNITLDNAWEKDFKRTAYLGGSVIGDHNKAVMRDLSAGTVIVADVDSDLARQMRELARYVGTCHVRTPEGSSFAADVQLSEGRAYNTGLINYSLKIQKVDSTEFDCITYDEWLKLHSEEQA